MRIEKEVREKLNKMRELILGFLQLDLKKYAVNVQLDVIVKFINAMIGISMRNDNDNRGD